MKIVADLHTHTIASGHAYGTIREMMAAAKEKNLELLGISEHAPGIPGTTDPFYYENLKVIPREIYGVQLLHGCELNVMNDLSPSLPERLMQKLDYAIIGIHGVCYTDAGKEKNTDNLIHYMKQEKVHFVSHPDDDHTPLNYERLVIAAKENEIALEVNNSSLVKKESRLNCYENYRTMLELCMKYQVPIIVSSDAHDPSWVAEHTLALQMLEDYGFDENLVLNTSVDKIKKFIHFA